MAVIDHEHVKLRLLYSRKKKLDKTVESLRNEVDELKVSILRSVSGKKKSGWIKDPCIEICPWIEKWMNERSLS